MARKRKVPSSPREQPIRDELVQGSDDEIEEEKSTEEDESESESDEEEEDDDSKGDSSEEEANQEGGDTEEDDSTEDREECKRATLRELLEPFGKYQIIDILKRATAEDPNLLPEIMRVADSDPTHRKIFVYGLGWDVTYDQLLQAFKPFGELEECKLITDKNTGRSKGYAFLLFKTGAAAKKALKIPQKKIGSRMASCQLAAFGHAAAADTGNRKIYIGNVGSHVNPEKLYSFFARFGEIEEGPLGIDPVTNRFKGYAVLTFKSVDGYKKAMEEPIKVFDNCQFHCKKFLDNQNKNSVSAHTSSGNMNPAVTDTCLGLNGGMLGNTLDARGLVLAQNQGIGLMGNPGLAVAYNPVGLVARVSGDNGVNSYSPGMMGSYGSQAALQGLGVIQNGQVGQSSVGAATRPLTSGISAPGMHPSYPSRNI